MKKTISLAYMILGILFCVCLITANVLEAKVIQIGGLKLTAGLAVFPLSYVINDCISEVWGFKKAKFIIWVGFITNFIFLAFGRLAVALPAAPDWQGAEGFNFIFGVAPRIVIASLTAFLVGSFLNAYVMCKLKDASEGRHFSFRAIFSTLVGEGADSLVFFPIAFLGLIPEGDLFRMIILQATIKTVYEVIALPLTICIVKYIKKLESGLSD